MDHSSIREQAQRLQQELTALQEQIYFEDVLFSFQWWLLVFVFVGAYTLLWIAADRDRLPTLLFVGSLIFGIVIVADGIGLDLLLWNYPYMAIPCGPHLISVDLVIPVAYVLLYQWFRGWRTYFIACTALAVLYAFVLEPLAHLVNIYNMYNWRHIYSFPIYIAIGLFAKWAGDTVEQISERGKSAC
jgi:hypothetical protein